jgi:hypothetical protein
MDLQQDINLFPFSKYLMYRKRFIIFVMYVKNVPDPLQIITFFHLLFLANSFSLVLERDFEYISIHMAAVMAASIGLHLLWQLVDLFHEYAF